MAPDGNVYFFYFGVYLGAIRLSKGLYKALQGVIRRRYKAL